MLEKIERNEKFDDKLEEALSKIKPPQEGVEPVAPEETNPPTNVETPVPEPAPQAQEPAPQEIPAEPPTDPATPAEPEPVEFNIKEFNERYGTEFTDEDGLKGSLTKLNDLGNYDQVVTDKDRLQVELDEMKQKYEDVAEALNPRTHFANEEEYKRQLILQKYGNDLNPALLNEIISKDLNQASDIDVLALGKLVANPNIIGGQQGAKEMVYRQLGVDSELSEGEWDNITKNLVLEAANNTRKELNKIKDIEVPEKVDYVSQKEASRQESEQKAESLKEDWTKVTNKLVEGFNEMSFTREVDGKEETYFSYAVSPEFKEAATEMVTGYLVDNGLTPNEENVKQARAYVEDLFWRKQGTEIMQAYGKDVEARLTEQKSVEQDNPAPQNQQEAPTPELDAKQQELIDYAKGGLGLSRKPGEQLFKT